MKKALSSFELKLFWNQYSKGYSNSFEHQDIPFHINLLNLTKVSQAKQEDNILELSIGGGNGFKYLINNTSSCNLFGGDISEEMITIAKNNLHNKIPNEKKVVIDVIDNEDLFRFKDNFFRTIVSSMSLHLVNEPSNVLKEVYRVIDKNNKESSCAFSVWGRPENNFIFTFIPNIFKRHNVTLPNIRSNFHLSKKDKAYSLFKEAGFKNIYCEYFSLPLSFTKPEELDFLLQSPLYSSIIKELPEEQQLVIVEDFRDTIQKEIICKNKMTFEALLIHSTI